MEVPEKLYILHHEDYSDRRIFNAFTEKESNTDIEYIRKDAFIDKAVEWLSANADKYIWYSDYAENIGDDTCGMKDNFIEDFKKYMKGE